ncbi:MAG: hypothetical protein LBD47_11570 [Treponema sp.]|jgi:hypothetical protein|nr:hypothetical protein [Treponema sp.]
MGNNNFRTVRFRQSVRDFPLTVSLGDKAPAWGLNRWASSGLRFLPPDDEGFTLRGDRRRLVYKGRRRSHRFTILGDTAFEYDCILNREPESNVVALLMEGAENFDFFRQPDFVKDPFLKGSYAVYKKETLLGEGTGKLCHIHRPQIIDSRGRRCWGDLSVTGNELRITIPETFLGEAKYPVIVDPVIGTSSIGSQTPQNVGTGAKNPWLIYEFGVNRYMMSEKCQGVCTAHVYCYDQILSIGDVTPLIFGDENDKPHYRRTRNEEKIKTKLVNTSNINIVYDPQWKTGSFETIGEIQEGDYIWFGGYGEAFWTKFDYGGTLYKNYPEVFTEQEEEEIYNEETGEWEWYEGVYYDLPDFPLDGKEKTQDCIFSWYFDFESLSKNYTRTLTQGITLTDSRKLTGAYKRSTTQTVKGTTALSRFVSFPRQCLETVYNTSVLKALPTLVRSVFEQVRAITAMDKSRGLSRNCSETIRAGSETKRIQGFYRKAYEDVKGTDTRSFPVLFLRSLPETVWLTDSKTQRAVYVRGLWTEAASMAKTRHGGEYYRKQADTVQAAGTSFRSLLIFVRLVTTSLIRDFLLRRFLKSNEELVLKSPVCRELIVDSSIH